MPDPSPAWLPSETGLFFTLTETVLELEELGDNALGALERIQARNGKDREQ